MAELLPLSGVKVLDLSALTPGPYATLMLAELGATVAKVERPGQGDPLRQMFPSTFDVLNCGKASIALDLKQPADQEALLTLCADADVFLEGFRPGVVDRLGVGYAAVSQRSPRIVYVSLSGYGQTGPLAQSPGHDVNYVARAGGLALSGIDAGLAGYDGTYQVADLAAASYTVVAVLAALRGQRSEAVHIDVSLWGSVLAMTQIAAAEAIDSGHAERPIERPRTQRGANGIFIAGDGLPFTISVVEDAFWPALCRSVKRPDLAADPAYRRYADRLRAGEQLNRELADVFRSRDRDEWIAVIEAAGVPCAPVLSWAEATESEQATALGLTTPERPGQIAIPLGGLPRAHLAPAPSLDAQGEALRSRGWAAVSTTTDGEELT